MINSYIKAYAVLLKSARCGMKTSGIDSSPCACSIYAMKLVSASKKEKIDKWCYSKGKL